MASYQITHIRLSHSASTSTEHITHVKLSSGTIESKDDVIRYIDLGHQYFYTIGAGYRGVVEVVRPALRNPYIRTKPDGTTKDNLLSLPKF